MSLNLALSSTVFAKTSNLNIVNNVNNIEGTTSDKQILHDEFNQIIDSITPNDFVLVYEQTVSNQYFKSLTREEKDDYTIAKLVENHKKNYKQENKNPISIRRLSKYLPDSYNRLNKEEKKLVKIHPSEALSVYSAAKSATEETIRRFGRNGEDDVSDAFRHAFWNADMTCLFYYDQIIGNGSRPSAKLASNITEKWATAHEYGSSGLPRTMDLYNNKLGRAIAVPNLPTNSSVLSDKVYSSIKSGNGKMIVNNKLVPTKL
ncbi:DUF6973 domain-containing protein [Clostridium tetani]|uniref:DUF6973 domain-containing protein n=1 Tax=Clostridium tetani TaxID=1513 RepID=UPI00100AB514|nr:hypothetical protein [Clostridium tetani]